MPLGPCPCAGGAIRGGGFILCKRGECRSLNVAGAESDCPAAGSKESMRSGEERMASLMGGKVRAKRWSACCCCCCCGGVGRQDDGGGGWGGPV